MLEHAIYSVISPEGCASILWRNVEMAKEAASALRLTAQDLLELGVIDAVVAEPKGGAHRVPQEVIDRVADLVDSTLEDLLRNTETDLKAQRREKFLAIGQSKLN